MRMRKTSQSMRWAFAGLMMLAFALRALVPQGFMPSVGNPLMLQICPDGLPTRLALAVGDPHAAHHMHGEAASSSVPAPPHHHNSASADHCLFGAGASGVALLSQISLALAAPAMRAPPPRHVELPLLAALRFRIA